VRRSALQQVQSDLESQQDQYELVDVARRRGFANAEIIAACPQWARLAPACTTACRPNDRLLLRMKGSISEPARCPSGCVPARSGEQKNTAAGSA
jgi:hypothetical protein